MQTYMVQVTRADGAKVQRCGLYTDGLAAVQIVGETFPDATSIQAEPFTAWQAAQQLPTEHDTARLPAGGFYFAPGVVEEDGLPSDPFGRAVFRLCLVLVVVGMLGGLAGYLQQVGWPQ